MVRTLNKRYSAAFIECERQAAELARLRHAGTACRKVADAYRTFVEAHGSLLDFSANAEMVDLDIALAAVVTYSEEPKP